MKGRSHGRSHDDVHEPRPGQQRPARVPDGHERTATCTPAWFKSYAQWTDDALWASGSYGGQHEAAAQHGGSHEWADEWSANGPPPNAVGQHDVR